jgi:O-antigen ligase
MLAFLKKSLQSRTSIEKLLWVLVLFFVLCISFSIAASHILLTALAFVYLYWKLKYDRHFPRVSILIPAFAFCYATLLSVIFSIHPSLSFIEAKDLAMFVIIPILYDTVKDLDDIKVIYGVLIFAGVISACYGLYQLFGLFGSEGNLVSSRLTGFMGHWMTFSGLLMILNVLLLSHLLFSKEHPVWFYPAFGILSITLFLTLTRSAWLGFIAASTVLIAMRKVRWVIAIPALLLMIFVGSILVFPTAIADRISSVFNPNETSNRDRLLMLQSGWQIIKDYPLTGVGPGMIKWVYPRYRAPDSLFHNSQHLHNNLVQLAAEKGFLALFSWLWLIGKVLSDLILWKRRVMNPDEQFMIHGTIGIVISLFVAGMFEFNFGDSEINMLFLVLITVPYAWHRTVERDVAPEQETIRPQDAGLRTPDSGLLEVRR